MKKSTLSCLFLAALLSCNKSDNVVSTSETIRLSPRLERAAAVTDSIWNLAASVHVKLTTTNGLPLLDDTLLFSKHASPVISAPSDQGVTIMIEGLSNTNTVVWSGSSTLPPSARDTTFPVTIAQVTTSGGGSISLGTVNRPTLDSFSVKPWAGTDTFDQPVHVYLSSTSPNAVIHYTLDGSYPTTASPIYQDTGVLVDSSQAINAIAAISGWTNSALQTTKVTLLSQSKLAVTTDIENWDINTYDQPVMVTLANATPNADIHYTLDGSIPNRNSPVYISVGILIDSTRTLNATTFAGKNQPSKMYSKEFKLQIQPIFFNGSRIWEPFILSLTSPTTGAIIYYTRNGMLPTPSDSVYPSSGLTLNDKSTIKAFAKSPSYPKIKPSMVDSYSYTPMAPWKSGIIYGSLLDSRDGRSYRTVKIGDQTWMAENLNFTPSSSADSSWCDGNDTIFCKNYGRLYSWAAAMQITSNFNNTTWSGSDLIHQGACPIGWHIPNAAEWKNLTDTLLDSSTSGNTLKSSGLWNNPGLDSLGFRIIPAGCHSGLFGFVDQPAFAHFWTATDDGGSKARDRSFNFNPSARPNAFVNQKYTGNSVRCIKN